MAPYGCSGLPSTGIALSDLLYLVFVFPLEEHPWLLFVCRVRMQPKSSNAAL